jgi:hypothetical protein
MVKNDEPGLVDYDEPGLVNYDEPGLVDYDEPGLVDYDEPGFCEVWLSMTLLLRNWFLSYVFCEAVCFCKRYNMIIL